MIIEQQQQPRTINDVVDDGEECKDPHGESMDATSLWMLGLSPFFFNPLIRLTVNIAPQLSEWLLFTKQTMYCLMVAEFCKYVVHEDAYLIIIPIAAWIAGLYQVNFFGKSTKMRSVNDVCSVVYMTITAYLLVSDYTYIVTAISVLATISNTVSMPRFIWDYTLTGFGLFFGFCAMIIYQTDEFYSEYYGTPQTLLASIIVIKKVFGYKSDSTQDSPLLKKIRWTGRWFNKLMLWTMINTFLYFFVGTFLFKQLILNVARPQQ